MARGRTKTEGHVVNDRVTSLFEVVKRINEKYGQGTIVRGSEASPEFFYPRTIETGILSLNARLGITGLPRGKFTEIWGHNQVGKSSTALWIIASAMKADPDFYAVYIDTEWRFDFLRAHEFGVDFSRLFIHQTKNGEEAIEIARDMLRSGVDLVVIDSVTGLLPTKMEEGDMDSHYIGVHARLISQASRVLLPSMAAFDRSRRGSVLFINQLRDNPGQMYGDPSAPTGGKALGFYSSLRLELRSLTKNDWIVDPETGDTIGQWIRFYVHKNSINGRRTEGRYPLLFANGIDPIRDAIEAGVVLGVIERGGAGIHRVTLPSGEVIQEKGADNFYKFLSENKQVTEAIAARCREILQENLSKAISLMLSKQGISTSSQIAL